MDDNKSPPMTPEEQASLLRRIAMNVDIAVKDGRATRIELAETKAEFKKDFTALASRVETIEQQVTAGVHLSGEDIPISYDPGALPPYRPPMESITEEMLEAAPPKESIRIAARKSAQAASASTAAAVETAKQTPMIARVEAETSKQTVMLTEVRDTFQAAVKRPLFVETVGRTLGHAFATGLAVFVAIACTAFMKGCESLGRHAGAPTPPSSVLTVPAPAAPPAPPAR